MASKFAGILLPRAEQSPQATGQPAGKDDSNNNMTTASEPTMSHDRAVTAPPQEHPTKKREDEVRAQSLEYSTHLEQAKHAAQPPSNSNNNQGSSTYPNTTPFDPRDTAATITALRQQLQMAEQHILVYQTNASHHISDLNIIRTSWDRNRELEANINHLVGEVHKANGYNNMLNQHVLQLRKEAETNEAKHQAALQAANARAKASASRTPPTTMTPPPPPPQPRAPPAAMQDTKTLLEHNIASVVKLRAEIRELKASKKQLQERLLTLGSVPPLDGSTFLQTAGLPREVLDEWSQVLLQRDREIAGLWVMVEREREAR
jgi:hypothetical protein